MATLDAVIALLKDQNEHLNRVYPRLNAIEQCCVRLEESLSTLCEQAETHEHILRGNGSPGIVARVDRIEQKDISRTWLIRTTIAASIVVIVTGIGAGIVALVKLLT